MLRIGLARRVLPVLADRWAFRSDSLGRRHGVIPRFWCRAAGAVALFAGSFAFASIGSAQELDVSGKYQCAQAKVRGKVVPCKAAPLTLKNDGRFELRGWEG